MSHSVNHRETSTAEKGLSSFMEARGIKLILNAVHDQPKKKILFDLDGVHLPGERGSDYFVYGGHVVRSVSAVKDPEPARCESIQTKNFLNNLRYHTHLFQVVTFGLRQVEVLYATQTSYLSVVRTFREACKATLSLEDEAITVVHKEW